MKNIKNKYIGKSKADLTQSLAQVKLQQTKLFMTVRDDAKAYGELRKLRYESALLQTLLTIESSK